MFIIRRSRRLLSVQRTLWIATLTGNALEESAHARRITIQIYSANMPDERNPVRG